MNLDNVKEIVQHCISTTSVVLKAAIVCYTC